MDIVVVGLNHKTASVDIRERLAFDEEASVGRIVNKMLHCVIRNINIVAKEQGATEAAKLAGSIVRHAGEIVAGDNDEKTRDTYLSTVGKGKSNIVKAYKHCKEAV